MALLGHWFHFGYAEQMDMEVDVWEMFLEEAQKFVANVNSV